ncbi:hypothetical protein [Rhizobium alvei]|uniref:Uncharacterized protein n=1 Tax=Rhizobium alvei TaxID=1132659 RepID=A0ABT8YUH8_9HYPH|nr:hypothetical protein [Rhizobium alvei]MDO6966938.1 hypothetical protein [Rhizobium alvei]
MSRYTYIIDKLREATGPDRELDWRIADALDIPYPWVKTDRWPPFAKGSLLEKEIPAYTASIDACVALVERMLPGYDWGFGRDAGAFSAGLSESFHSKIIECFGPTLPLAILRALFQALEEKEMTA